MGVLIWIVTFIAMADTVFAEEIRDIKPPVDVPGGNFFLFLFLGLLVGFVGFSIKSYLDRKNKIQGFITPKSSWDRAFDRLNDLRDRNLPAQGQLKEYYSELSLIIRQYMEERFLIKASEMTTQEFLNYLQNSEVLSPEQKGFLNDFLTACDMVKFAKHQMSQPEIEESLNLARQLVNETKALTVSSDGI